MNNRGGSVEQLVSRPPFPIIEAQTLNAPKPLICMAVLEAVYLFCLLLVFTEGRIVNQIFWAVRKLLQGVANGTRFVPGGCSGNHWQRMFRLPASGDYGDVEIVGKPLGLRVMSCLIMQGQRLSSPILLVIFISFGFISHNTPKTPEPLSIRIGKDVDFFRFSQNIFGKSLSLPHYRHDHFSMSNRANIRQPGKPVTKRHSIEAEGVFYDDYGRETQESF
jgi:hypothetical protein